MDIPIEAATEENDVRAAVRTRSGADLAVDALLGTGITGEVREPFASAIEPMNNLGSPVLAVDVPSGLDCDTGRPQGCTVRAERTVTFVLNKRGFLEEGAEEYTGEVQVAEISVPRRLIESKVMEWSSGIS